MIKKTLFVHNSLNLFEILNEIKENLTFDVKYIEKKNLNKNYFDQHEQYLVLTTKSNLKLNNSVLIQNFPKKINKIIEMINLSFLKIQFKSQSKYKIGKYILDINSRKIFFDNESLSLTEKEANLIVFINSVKKASLKKIQEIVWTYSNDLETHTVETHIYRLRKKILKSFQDSNFIKHDQDGYFLN